MGRDEMTARIIKAMEHPQVDIIGHPTGRLLGQREAYEVDMERLAEAAKKTHTALEINASPQRLDLSDAHARLARERGVMLVISTDAHSRYELAHMEYGIGVARRAWVEPKDVLNTRSLKQLRSYLDPR